MWLNSHDPKWLNFKRPLTISYKQLMAYGLVLNATRKEVPPMRPNNGFSLIELLTVISILGILMALSIPNLK